ncbi:MAG: Allantoicase [Bogoriella megaspora]|nr:MAG: Allantoicase [Bogoriella megaspora]
MEIPIVPPETLTATNPSIQSIPANEIDSTFTSTTIDLVSAGLDSHILSHSDEWFASSSNLLTPTPPIRRPGVFTYAGAWYDGWETRRHNSNPFDWVVIRLGVASGVVEGVEIDTAFFDGNHAPEIALEGCYVVGEGADERVSKFEQAPEVKEGEDGKREGGGEGFWKGILGRRECGPSRRQAWRLVGGEGGRREYTHVRLLMFPDGGIARLRVYGRAVPVFPKDVGEAFDLASARNGGVAIACSDQHFGRRENLLLPGRGKDMGDGWETKRSRGEHVDWVVVKLGCIGEIDKVVVDTAHFRGNFPRAVKVFAAEEKENGEAPDGAGDVGWTEILGESKTGPDKEHEFEKGTGLSNIEGKAWRWIKLVIIPDGGVKRLKVFGRRKL